MNAVQRIGLGLLGALLAAALLLAACAAPDGRARSDGVGAGKAARPRPAGRA
ncbi:hypothetical protein ABT143_08000 [Streptomyces sp. NPDC002033]|uniref:hypothetical protein n=1 Tax=unclassified Streptomyces TaxID=2593676 RepID=UPI003320471A